LVEDHGEDGRARGDVRQHPVVPAATLPQPRAGGVDGQRRRHDGVGLTYRLGGHRRPRGLGRSARGAYLEILRPPVIGPRAAQAGPQDGQQHPRAALAERLQQRVRARLRLTGDVGSDTLGRPDRLHRMGGQRLPGTLTLFARPSLARRPYDGSEHLLGVLRLEAVRLWQGHLRTVHGPSLAGGLATGHRIRADNLGGMSAFTPRLRKAVLPATGRGLRYAPATKAVPKEM